MRLHSPNRWAHGAAAMRWIVFFQFSIPRGRRFMKKVLCCGYGFGPFVEIEEFEGYCCLG
jgi:hypothetical protein